MKKIPVKNLDYQPPLMPPDFTGVDLSKVNEVMLHSGRLEDFVLGTAEFGLTREDCEYLWNEQYYTHYPYKQGWGVPDETRDATDYEE